MGRPLRPGVPWILKPDDLPRGAPRRGRHVRVAVAVQVARHRLEGAGKRFQDGVPGPRAVSGRAVVFVPDDPGAVLPIRTRAHAHGHNQIRVAVSIHVHRVAVHGPAGLFVDEVTFPGSREWIAAVFVPEDQSGGGCGSHQVFVAVAVHVGHPDATSLGDVGVNQVLGPLPSLFVAELSGRTVAQRPRVLEPGELVPHPPGGGGHVRISVAVQVRDRHVVGAGQPGGDDVPLPQFPGVVFPRILEPEEVTVQILDDHHVGVGVLVDVAHHVPLQPLRVVLLDEAAGEGPRPVVLEPVEVVGRSVVRTGQVQVPVLVQVGGPDAVGIGVAIHDQVLGEADRTRILEDGLRLRVARRRLRRLAGRQDGGQENQTLQATGAAASDSGHWYRVRGVCQNGVSPGGSY